MLLLQALLSAEPTLLTFWGLSVELRVPTCHSAPGMQTKQSFAWIRFALLQGFRAHEDLTSWSKPHFVAFMARRFRMLSWALYWFMFSKVTGSTSFNQKTSKVQHWIMFPKNPSVVCIMSGWLPQGKPTMTHSSGSQVSPIWLASRFNSGKWGCSSRCPVFESADFHLWKLTKKGMWPQKAWRGFTSARQLRQVSVNLLPENGLKLLGWHLKYVKSRQLLVSSCFC